MPVHYLNAGQGWDVPWPQPGMATGTWRWDCMHCPSPIGPLAAEIGGAWYEAAFDEPGLAINGYVYMPVPEEGFTPPSASVSMAQAIEVWEHERRPRIAATVHGIRSRDWDVLDAPALLETAAEAIAQTAEGFALTIRSSGDLVPALTAFLEFCGAHWGRRGPVLGMRMLQGHPNASTDSARGLQQLAVLARASAELTEAVRAGRLDEIAQLPGGPEFLVAFDGYLETYGWRLPGWVELHRPTWAEQPALPLGLVARYLDEASAGVDALDAAAAGRAEAIAEAEADLDEATTATLHELLAEATGYVAVIEGRALWQQQLMACLRVPFLALGAKLTDAGTLAQPDDPFFCSLDELRAAAAGRDQREAAAQARAQLERWQALIPPLELGAPLKRPPGIAEVLMDAAGLVPSDEARIVNGFGASPGVVSGTARVVTNAEELHRVEPGDVLVTGFTAPIWTPAFGVAAAVVTDFGGILSHAAIAAREYALPAVVGTQVGTAKIPDGARVTVDGGQGLVRIDG